MKINKRLKNVTSHVPAQHQRETGAVSANILQCKPISFPVSDSFGEMHLLALLLKNNEKSGLMPQLSMGKQV